jgi:SAM-dependent methyltransferase
MAHFSHLLTHGAVLDPSDWVCRHADHIKTGGEVLDVACGSGRNARWLAAQGWSVEAVDRDRTALDTLKDVANVHTTLVDLENAPWPYDDRLFDGIVVCRYLHRPLLKQLIKNLKPDGVLIYETFMLGHEQYGRPTNPDFLLKPDELLTVYGTELKLLAFEQGQFDTPKPSVIQRICVKNT